MITIYTLSFNEELLAQFMIDHYRSRFPNCEIIIYDNSSTDNTVDIATSNNCEVRRYETSNSLNDGIHMNIKNNCWRDAKTDWVLVCDFDELLDINEDQLKKEENNGVTIINSECWHMVNLNDDFNLYGMRYGYRTSEATKEKTIYDICTYDKCLLFNKKYINSINYGAGCHHHNPAGIVKYSEPYIMKHYKFINPDFSVSRTKITANRISDENKSKGWGVQCFKTEDEIRSEFDFLRANSKLVPIK